MSKEALTWARGQRIADSALLSVLRAVAFFADKGTFECCKSQAVIATETGMSIRAVRYALAILESLEVVSRRARSNGFSGRTSDAITLSSGRNFDISKPAIVALRNSMQSAKSASCDKSSNRQILPLQPADSAGDNNTVNTDTLAQRLDTSFLSSTEGTTAHTTCDAGVRGISTHAQGNILDLPPNVVMLRQRGAA